MRGNFEFNNIDNLSDIHIDNLEGVKLKRYQEFLKSKMQLLFQDIEIETEWNAMRDERALNIYSPRVDLAVGPFATHERHESIYDNMLDLQNIRSFLQKLIGFYSENLMNYGDYVTPRAYDQVVYQNLNARCFMAVEIENKVSRKHLMGGAINASALGRVGIVIPWTKDKLKAFIKLVRYMQYLKDASKNMFNTTNLLIVTKEQFHMAFTDELVRIDIERRS